MAKKKKKEKTMENNHFKMFDKKMHMFKGFIVVKGRETNLVMTKI
jgi:hypothetical protein